MSARSRIDARKWLAATAACLSTGAALAATPDVCTGAYHSMALRSDGHVLTWGWDGYGQLGIGRLLFRFTPGQIDSLSNVRTVSSRSDAHALAIGNDGRLYAWGDNDWGTLGDGTFLYRGNAIVTVGLSGVSAASSGDLYSLALTQDGRVWSWGANYYGQLGDGTTHTRATPQAIPGLANVSAISAGYKHAVALLADGSVWAWGQNTVGQLGNGTTISSAAPVMVTGLSGITAIAAGNDFTMALKNDGTVWAWGDNTHGELGDNTQTDRPTPVLVMSSVRAISAGGHFAAALRTDGTLWTWGANSKGQLGIGFSNYGYKAPQQVTALSGAITAVSAGDQHMIALKSDGTLLGWGYNVFGQLGLDGAQYDFVESPLAIPGVNGVTDIAAGYDVSFAVSQGRVFGWGKNNYQQLATGVAQPPSQTTPAVVPGLDNVVAIACERYGSLALKSDGSLYAWGYNGWGALGDGTLLSRSSPVRVIGLPPIAKVSASRVEDNDTTLRGHVLAVDRSGTLWVWGSNSQGQLGNGTLEFSNGNDFYTRTPISLGGLPPMTDVSAGTNHSLAIDNQGHVWAWGNNANGQLGDGTNIQRITPVMLGTISGVVQVAAGWNFSLALTSDRSAWSWGAAYGGELGTGAVDDQYAPVRITTLANVQSISAGSEHGLAVLTDRSLWTWGYNDGGEIGDGSFSERARPIRIWRAGEVLTASAGNFVTLAALPGGAALAWGINWNGQLGDGTFAYRTTPQIVLEANGAGYLNLLPEASLQVPVDKVAPFSMLASGDARSAAANVTATFTARPQDVGNSANIYVFALAPANRVLALKDGQADDFPLKIMARNRGHSKDAAPVPCVLAQLTASGQLQQVTAASLQSYVSTVLTSQTQAVTVLNGVQTAQIAGATFYLGYGSNPAAMLGSGTNRSVVSLEGTSQCHPAAPQTGWWWNPNEDGRGYSIEVQGNHIFFAAFLYDVSGRASWLVSTGSVSLDGALYQGDLLSAKGGQSLGGAYPGFPALRSEGAITLAFDDASHGTLVWPGGTVPIQRFNIVPNGLNAAPQFNQPETGWWWNPDEAGRGFFLEWQNGVLDIAGYMYDDAGNPIWYLTENLTPSTNLQQFSSNWWQFANGMTLFGPWKPHQQISDHVAPVTITFQGSQAAIMTLPNGRTTTLRRHRF